MGTGWQEHLNSLGAKFVAQSTVVVSPVTDEIRSLQQLDGAIVLQKLGVIRSRLFQKSRPFPGEDYYQEI